MSMMTDIMILFTIVVAAVLLIYIITKIIRKPTMDDVGPSESEKIQMALNQRWGVPAYQHVDIQERRQNDAQIANYCSYCGKKDFQGTFCAYCGKRLR